MTNQNRPGCRMTRRSLVTNTGLAALAAGLLPRTIRAMNAPAAPVALARCQTYGAELLPALAKMFDQIGGLGRLVNGKTVAVKINLTGDPDSRLGYIPIGFTTWTHPSVIGATVHLLGKAGARRIRLLESPWKSAEPVQEYMTAAGWDPAMFTSAADRVEFENTNYLGTGKRYAASPCPTAAISSRAFDLNHSYEDCDVFVSIAKMKDHATAGITLSMKNCFGITPCTIYGDGAPEDEPGVVPSGGRGYPSTGHPSAVEEFASGDRPQESAPGRLSRTPLRRGPGGCPPRAPGHHRWHRSAVRQ